MRHLCIEFLVKRNVRLFMLVEEEGEEEEEGN